MLEILRSIREPSTFVLLAFTTTIIIVLDLQVHDMFNWLSVLVLLPLEAAVHYLEWLTGVIVNSMHLEQQDKTPDMLKAITKPLTALVVEVRGGGRQGRERGEQVEGGRKGIGSGGGEEGEEGREK